MRAHRGALGLLACALCAVAACGGGEDDFHAQSVPDTLGMFTVWAFAPDDVWAAGSTKTIHWDGQSWFDADSPLGGALDLHGLGPDDLWAVNGTAAAHWDGIAWEYHELAEQGSLSSLGTVWEIAPDDVWVGGAINGEALHWDGVSWTLTITQLVDVTEMWAAGPDDLWAAGLSGVAHWNGAQWTDQDLPGSAEGLWGFSANDVWAADTFGSVSHYDGDGWTTSEVEDGDFTAIWGAAANDLWAVGQNGAVARWNGLSWTNVADLGFDMYLNAVHGSGAGDIWIAGTDQDDDFAGVVLRYDP